MDGEDIVIVDMIRRQEIIRVNINLEKEMVMELIYVRDLFHKDNLLKIIFKVKKPFTPINYDKKENSKRIKFKSIKIS